MYKIVSFIAFVACLTWAIAKPAYDSITAAIIAFSTLIGLFYKSSTDKNSSQKQNVEAGSIGIQAGGNVSANNIKVKK